MKKNLLLSSSLVLLGVCALASCGKKESNNVVSFEKAYDASVLSGIGLLDGGAVAKTVSYNTSLMDLKEDDKDSVSGVDKLSESLKGEILDNLAIAKNTLNGDSKKSEIKKSDKEEWEEMYTITQKDIDGNDIVYTFYYTETLKEEEKKDDKKEDEEEIEKHIKGIVLVEDQKYDVTGDREIEGDEQEVKYKVMLDEKNYVIIESEVEGTENEYEYSKYVDGKRVFKSEVEYEINEDGEVEIEFETKTPENGKVKFSYEFVKNANSEDIIKVEVKKSEEGLKGEATIKVTKNENGEFAYEFTDYKEKKSK